MDVGPALDRLRSALGPDLRVFAVAHEDHVDVVYARDDIDRALAAATADDTHQANLQDVASAMLTPGGTASIRYTPDAIVVGMPAPSDDGRGYLLSLEHAASDAVEGFIDTLLANGATVLESTTTRTVPPAERQDQPNVN